MWSKRHLTNRNFDNSDWETIFSDDDDDEVDYDGEDYEDKAMSLDDMHFTYAHLDGPESPAKPVTHTYNSESKTDEELRIEAWLVGSSPAPTPLQVELDFGDMPFQVYEEPEPIASFVIPKMDRQSITANLKKLLQRRHLRRVSGMNLSHGVPELVDNEQDLVL